MLSASTSVVGLIVSIVAFRKSKRAGFKNGAALAGIVVGAITTLGILTAGIAAGVAATSLVNTCQDLGPARMWSMEYLHLRLISRLSFAWVGTLDIEGSDRRGAWGSLAFIRLRQVA